MSQLLKRPGLPYLSFPFRQVSQRHLGLLLYLVLRWLRNVISSYVGWQWMAITPVDNKLACAKKKGR